jgi:hypothetical protein
MEMKRQFKFQYADSWLLLAIIYAERQSKSNLSGIIGYGDFINHAIFTLEELQGGMFRLIQSGYVTRSQDRYLPTEKILKVYKKFSKPRNFIIKEFEFIRTELDAPEWSEKYDPSKSNKDGVCKEITEKVLQDAYKNYVKEIKKEKLMSSEKRQGG